MAFEDHLASLVEIAREQRANLATEEAVKTAVVLRIIKILEYDPFNPKEVIPEYTADVGIKRGEKVDYAICMNDDVQILIECKSPSSALDLKHASQLYRYFSVTNARFAILTNGFEWQFYTDLDSPNKMDAKPFFRFDLLEMDPSSAAELSKFRKSVFSVAEILKTANDLKYVSALKSEIKIEFSEPSEELVRLIGKRVYAGQFTPQVREQFTRLLKRSIGEVLRDRVNARLASALQHNTEITAENEENSEDIETTEEEWDGYRIAVAIAAEVLSPDRIAIRDTKSYCGVLVDDNNRKPLVRLWFNSPTTRYLSLFDGDLEERVPVGGPVDLYKFANRIKATAQKYA